MSTTALATAPNTALSAVSMFGSAELFALVQQQAELIAKSDLIPKQFQGNVPNCAIALEMAARLGASPFAVIQNLDVIHGRPSWRAVFLMGLVNNCGRFTPLQFKVEETGPQQTIDLIFEAWEGPQGNRRKTEKKKPYTYTPTRCVAWANDRATGAVVEGPPVSYDMAIQEGWVAKDGSKWLTEMRELMLRYRAASFFAKVYASDVMLGMQTSEENYDIGPEMRQAEGREVQDEQPTKLPTVKPNPFKGEAPTVIEQPVELANAAAPEAATVDRKALTDQIAAGIKASGRKNSEAFAIFIQAGLMTTAKMSDASDEQLVAIAARLDLLEKAAEEQKPEPEPIATPDEKEQWISRIEDLGLGLEPPLTIPQLEAAFRKAKVLSTTETMKGCAVKRLEGFHANFGAIMVKAGEEGA